MAIAFPSLCNLLSSLLSKSPSSPPKLSTSFPPLVESPKSASRWAPLVATWGPTSSSSSLPVDDEITRIVCPSLAHANALFYKSGYYNVQVIVEEDEPEEKLLNRFRRAVLRAGILQECKRRKFFESSQDKKKRKAREVAKRNRKRHPQPKQAKQEAPKKRKEEDEDDNWELPEGYLPY